MSGPVRLIGIEEHFLTDEVLSAWEAIGLSAKDPSAAFHSGETGRRLMNLADERLALMDETGVDVQVLSLTTPALHDLGVEGVDIARRANDAIAELIARRPGRFQGLATLPVAMPDDAATELKRCISELGFGGAMLCGRVGERNLDHPDLFPILQAADRLGAPLLLHPRTPPEAVRSAYYSGLGYEVDAALATFGMGWHYDAGMQFVRLVASGTLDLLPNLQLILGHWGEVVLFYSERLSALDRVANLDLPFADYLRRNLHITASGMFSRDYLQRAASIVGTDRLLFSTDYPYQYRPGRDARRFIDDCGLTGEDLAAFAHGNWERLTARST